jgi:hypothetical protein
MRLTCLDNDIRLQAQPEAAATATTTEAISRGTTPTLLSQFIAIDKG